MRTIFLDIDGVLWTNFWTNLDDRKWRRFTPNCVECLNVLVEKTNARIVISSTWRLSYNLPKLRKHFEKCGFNYPKSIVGVTPSLASRLRGEEIQAWLDANPDKNHHIVILDDDSDMVHLLPRLVKTDFLVGLDPKAVVAAIQMILLPWPG